MGAAVFVMLLAVAAVSTVAIVSFADNVTRLAGGYDPAVDANSAALTYMLDAETGLRGYALTGRSNSLAPYRTAIGKVLPAIDAATQALSSVHDHSLDAALRSERALAAAWIDQVARRSTSSPATARTLLQQPLAKARFDRFRAANTRVASSLNTSRAALRRSTDRQRTIVLPVVIVGTVLVLLLVGFVALRTARSVSRPLSALWDVVRRLETGDLSARADERAGPAEVRDVSAAVNSLAVERARAVAAERAHDVLRRETRELTSAIRIGQDAEAIARNLVTGLGRVFDVDQAWLYTFDDPRVTLVAERWSHGGTAHAIDQAEPEGDRSVLRGIASRLWHGNSVVAVADLRRPGDVDDPHICVVPQATNARACALAAVGEGKSAFGLLWLSMQTRTRTWTSTELGLLQHVAAELAQNLVQNHILSRQREAMRLLREADEAKSTLVSTVSHELRTPLTSIVGYLELLEAYADQLPPGVADMLRVIERNTARLRALIDDLLTQSQIDAGRRLVTLDRIDLADVLTELVETIKPLAGTAELRLEFDPPAPRTLIVEGDARQLSQAVSNLASNALKFTPAGGSVTIRARREGSTAVVEVSDTGIGIPAAEVPHLFDRFFRASNARDAVIPGTGLGLGIVAEIVNQHHGRVDVFSELGAGTRFVIRLPILASNGARVTTDASPAGSVESG